MPVAQDTRDEPRARSTNAPCGGHGSDRRNAEKAQRRADDDDGSSRVLVRRPLSCRLDEGRQCDAGVLGQ
jgi:hypothetical protein